MIPLHSMGGTEINSASENPWNACTFLTCSVLPVRMACNLRCRFCFSKSSISSLAADRVDWSNVEIERYYEFAQSRGAQRLVITGGGEPLLKPDDVISLVQRGKPFFDEITCFTNGAYLTSQLANRLQDAGLSYLCYSRHHYDDARCRELMGRGTPPLEGVVEASGNIPIRATCVMARGWIDSSHEVDRYMAEVSTFGIRQFTFKHTYVAYDESVFAASEANAWSRDHQIEADPFAERGTVVAKLPWGPEIRQLGPNQVCYYYEPTPNWELDQRLCRSINLLSDQTAYASLEDQRSRLFRLTPS